MKKARRSLISFRPSNGEPKGGWATQSWVPHSIAFCAIEWGRQTACAIRLSMSARHGLHPAFPIPCASALHRAAFDRVDSTSLTSPSWIRQGATPRTKTVARSGSPDPDMHFRVSLKVTPKCKIPYVVGHAR